MRSKAYTFCCYSLAGGMYLIEKTFNISPQQSLFVTWEVLDSFSKGFHDGPSQSLRSLGFWEGSTLHPSEQRALTVTIHLQPSACYDTIYPFIHLHTLIHSLTHSLSHSLTHSQREIYTAMDLSTWNAKILPMYCLSITQMKVRHHAALQSSSG